MHDPQDEDLDDSAIAIVGMAGRFPGADDLEGFWRNLAQGVESIVALEDDELEAAGIDRATLADPGYVKAAAPLAGVELFDAPFFGYAPREAEILDPQQRLFLECAWEALEDAGHGASGGERAVGVYGGTSLSSYLFLLHAERRRLEAVGLQQAVIANAPDFLTSRVAYKLDLKGPALTVQSACSTALSAVHVARQALLGFECDLALAGAAAVRVPQGTGYFHDEGGILSPDGHCRAFDARAAGTVFGNGVGVVVLRRLEDALADGDRVRAVIRGSAANNDGALKAGFTAPSVGAQAEVISEALAEAGVAAGSVGYVEGHGTGTALGDPIEIAALEQAWRHMGGEGARCALGSVKTNVGHLDAAAGIAGLIKTVLALERRQLPPTLHFERPAPETRLEESPFYVNDSLAPWRAGDGPRRAGVSSFGFGGTNVHLVLEEAPAREPSGPSRPWQLLVLSARTEAALERALERLADRLEAEEPEPLADVAFTLAVGRKAFPERCALVCRDAREAAARLRAGKVLRGGAEEGGDGRDPGEGGELLARLATAEEARQRPLLEALGRLWTAGGEVDWGRLFAGERRQRVPLPTYPFERRRYWVDGVATPSRAAARAPEPPAAPRTWSRDELEERLAGLWREALGIERVGRHDDFFELGGHSLMATQLQARMRRELGLKASLDDLFVETTVAGLARRLATRAVAETAAETASSGDETRDGAEAALSFAQERLFLLHELEPRSAAYNEAFAAWLRGPLDVAALAAAVSAIVGRHAALRTLFHRRDGKLAATVEPALEVGLPLVDLQALAPARRQAAAREVLVAAARRPFDLARGPLVRLLLARAAPGKHAALLLMHHIVSDGWSMGVFLRELGALYGAAVAGEPSPLAPLPLQYADHAARQRRRLAGKTLERRLAYWRGRLAGAPDLELVTDRPRSSEVSERGAVVRRALAPALRRHLERLGRQRGASPFMVLLAAFQALLARLGGQTDLSVGSPVASRRPETEGLIGFFVNVLVLRTDLGGDPGFGELLARVREVTLGAYAHGDLPFERLVAELAPRRQLGRTPLFQVMLALQDVPVGLELPEVEASSIDLRHGAVKFDLAASFAPTGDGLRGDWSYRRELFDAATVERLAMRFEILLAAAIGDPERPLSALALLTAAERQQTLREWSDLAGGDAGTEGVPLVAELVSRRVRRQPDAVAVIAEGPAGGRLSYRELDARAGRLAAELGRLGVGPESLVGVAMERSGRRVEALLAVFQADAAYLPLDPSLPPERLAFLIEDAGAGVLLSEEKLAGRLPAASRRELVCVDRGSMRAIPSDAGAGGRRARDGNLAYVIYTSGSTGRPKGVAMSHGALARRLRFARRFELAEGARFLHKTTISFDVAVVEVFGPLMAGGCTVLARPGGERDVAYLADLVVRQRVTAFSFPPTALSALVERDGFERAASLAVAVTGGEAVPAELPGRFYARLDCDLLNRYGPTETAVSVTSWRCLRGRVERPLPIGRPIAGARILVLDRRLRPLPAGVPGELAIAGPGLARGYLHRSGLTAERFCPHPAGGRRGERVYRSGDLARFRHDGALEFLGRIDQQVQIHGLRVELGEIEAALRRHPAVIEAAVVARDDGPAGRGLAAFVVAENGFEPRQVRGFLARGLPAYMLPQAYVALDALPLAPTGKVDRAALGRRPLAASEWGTAGEHAAPRGEVEATLARIWAGLLKRQRVGARDNFFELGGDSILTLQVVARAAEAGLRLTPRQLFENQTIAELARVVGTTPEPRAEQGLVSGAVPLTPIQRWFFDRDFADPHHFNQAVLLELERPLAPEVLAAALALLPRHHDALRLRFRRRGGEWRQEHGEVAGAAPLAVIDLRASESRAGGFERASAQVAASLDLERGPLVRGALVREPGGELLLLVIHHLVVDGLSWRVLLEDFERACRQLERGEAVELPPKTTSFRAWAEHSQERGEPTAPAAPEESEPPPLPVDHLGEPTAGSARTVSRVLDAEITRALVTEATEAYGNRVDELLLAALVEAVVDWRGGPRRLVLDVESHGRDQAGETLDLSRTVGWLTALAPLRVDLEGARDAGEALQSVKEQLRAGPRRGAVVPAPEVVFNYLGRFERKVGEGGLFALSPRQAAPALSPRARRSHLLDVNAALFEGRLEARFTYSESVHRHATVERLADAFVAHLDRLVGHCLTPDAGAYTPSDFADVDLDQDELDRIVEKLG